MSDSIILMKGLHLVHRIVIRITHPLVPFHWHHRHPKAVSLQISKCRLPARARFFRFCRNKKNYLPLLKFAFTTYQICTNLIIYAARSGRLCLWNRDATFYWTCLCISEDDHDYISFQKSNVFQWKYDYALGHNIRSISESLSMRRVHLLRLWKRAVRLVQVAVPLNVLHTTRTQSPVSRAACHAFPNEVKTKLTVDMSATIVNLT